MNRLEPKRYNVTELTLAIRSTLEGRFSNVTVEGEISNFRPSSTGHFYFTLKDPDSVISVVMFRNRTGSLTFTPQDGQLVLIRGNVSVYAKRGTYQVICERMELAGEGDLLAMLERRKRALAAEGLFDESRKKPIPLLPSRIAVVTSPTGAAIRDILRVLRRRNSNVHLVILPAPVQGDEAAPIIAKQIRNANRFGLGEVVIIGRGGGSVEDLLAFSDEVVVRAVADSELPVISAVGHEIDTALSDLAADIRAPTPSAAAEMVAAGVDELAQRVRDLRRSLAETMAQRTDRIRLLLEQFAPENMRRNFEMLLQPYLVRLDDAKEAMLYGMRDCLTAAKHRVQLLSKTMESYSPLSVLERGYAVVTRTETGELVRRAADTEIGDHITVRMSEGRVQAEVEEIRDDEEL
jgi:exodeoxyribonuclease VII large subunit